MAVILRSETVQAHENVRPGARPWDRTGSVDVEALAHWAYAVQMVERFERAGLHPIEAEASGYEVRRTSTDGVGQLMRIHHLGCRVDAGAVSVSDAVHPAAWAVAGAVLAVEGGELVRSHGRSGTRPTSWQPPLHKVRPAMWSKPGREAAVEYQGPGRKGGYCPVIWTWDEGREAWGRDLYRRWWMALSDVAWKLSMRALGFTVTGPAAPALPWQDDGGQGEGGEGGEGAPPNGSSQRTPLQ
jgi:hypothetical protein